MDFALTEEQEMIVKATRDFVREELMPVWHGLQTFCSPARQSSGNADAGHGR